MIAFLTLLVRGGAFECADWFYDVISRLNHASKSLGC